MRRFIFSALTMLLGALAAQAQAQNAPPAQPVAGVVAAIDGQTLTVKSADGKTVTVKLADNAVVAKNKKVDFSAIKSGDFIASAAVEKEDGKLHAQELRIFPEALRGVGEGHRPMAQPKQTMTNATVAEITGTSSGGVSAHQISRRHDRHRGRSDNADHRDHCGRSQRAEAGRFDIGARRSGGRRHAHRADRDRSVEAAAQAGGATESRPTTLCFAMRRATRPEAFASSTKALR